MRSHDAGRPGWRVDFFALLTVQFVAAAGFNVASPFIPLFIQDLGVNGVREAAVWAGLMGAAGGLVMAVSSPVWGVVADRYGRKPMVVRATAGAAVFQAAMGLSATVQQLVVLRGLMSLVSGVQPAVMALAATIIPAASLGLAMDALQTVTALGSTVGPMLGGWLAAAVGYRPTFYVTGFLLFLSGILCLIVVREDSKAAGASVQRQRASAGYRDVLRVPGMTSLLVVVMISRAAGGGMAIAIPLILQEMAGGSRAVAGTAGTVVGLTALAMATGALVWGRLGDRIGQARVLTICLIASALLALPQVFVHAPWQLALGQMAYTFTLAGLLPSATALIGIIGPRGRQGVTYGASGTALALGNAVGPSLAAALIGAFGTRSMFVGVAVILLALLVLVRQIPAALRAQAG